MNFARSHLAASLLFFWALFGLFPSAGCWMNLSGEKTPAARRGTLDLRDWNFQKNGPAELKGEWEFYWKKFIPPERFQKKGHAPPSAMHVPVPGAWNKYKIGDAALGSDGFGTYRLRILLPPEVPGEPFYLNQREIFTAARIYSNGRLIYEAGVPGENARKTRPGYKVALRSLGFASGEVNLVYHAANYRHHWAGLRKKIYLGTDSQLNEMFGRRQLAHALLCGALFLLGIYNLALFVSRIRGAPAAAFGIFCLLIFTRRMFYDGGWLMSYVFPGMDWTLMVRLDFLTYYLAVPAFALFVFYLFVKERRSYVVLGLCAAGALYSLMALFLPTRVFTMFTLYYHLATLVMMVWSLIVMARAVKAAQTGSLISLFGTVVYFMAVINEILISEHLLPETFFHFVGLFVFLVAQSAMLGRLSAKALNNAENLSRALREKNNKLMHLDRMKDEFLANTSHELRTPLTGIIGLAEANLFSLENKNAVQENSRLIVAGGRRLSALINDILDFSKMKIGEVSLNIRAADAVKIAEVVTTLSRPLVRDKNVELILDFPPDSPLVRADENRLEQILFNLTDNAIKFTYEGRVIVSGKLEPAGDEANTEVLRISVSDTGIGIPRENHARIFRPFEQADGSISRGYGGTGLGLAIVSRLITLHGSRLELQSEPGQGSVFSFTLPLALEEARREAGESVSGVVSLAEEMIEEDRIHREILKRTNELRENKNQIILAVDDEPVNLRVIRNHLEASRYTVRVASDGFQALELLEKEKPDLVLLDLMMPGMSGFEVASKIRETYDRLELPIIILTAKNQLEDLVHGFQSGANDYLTKPFFHNELMARVETHLNLEEIHRKADMFVPRDFLKLLNKESLLDVRLGDQCAGEMSVLFSDIRSYSALAEKMDPAEAFAFLNEYLRRIGPVIRSHGGFVNQYFGDGIMAIFPDSPDEALKAAAKIIEAVRDFKSGDEPVRIGVGLHYGELMLGFLGDEMRMDGVAVSDTVNLSSRMEGLTKLYGASIIISDSVYSALSEPDRFHYRFLDFVRVEGMEQLISVIEVLDGEHEITRELKNRTRESFEEAILLYRQEDFEKAAKLFQEILARNPEDRAASIYLERSLRFEKEGVPSDWVFTENFPSKKFD